MLGDVQSLSTTTRAWLCPLCTLPSGPCAHWGDPPRPLWLWQEGPAAILDAHHPFSPHSSHSRRSYLLSYLGILWRQDSLLSRKLWLLGLNQMNTFFSFKASQDVRVALLAKHCCVCGEGPITLLVTVLQFGCAPLTHVSTGISCKH